MPTGRDHSLVEKTPAQVPLSQPAVIDVEPLQSRRVKIQCKLITLHLPGIGGAQFDATDIAGLQQVFFRPNAEDARRLSWLGAHQRVGLCIAVDVA